MWIDTVVRTPDAHVGGVRALNKRRSVRRRLADDPHRPDAGGGLARCATTGLAVITPLRMTWRRIYENICIRCAGIDRSPATIEDVRQMLLHHETIHATRTPAVHWHGFLPVSPDTFIQTTTDVAHPG